MSRALRIGLLAAAAVAVVAASRLLPVGESLLALVDWIRGAGPAGVLVFALVYVASTVLLLPASILTLGAGFVWGLGYGVLLVSPVSVLAATCAFLIGRALGSRRLAARVASRPLLGAIEDAIRADGFRILLLLRLSPLVPFNLLNYAVALTPMRTGAYVLASFVGMLPGTFLYIYLGSLVTDVARLLADRPDGGAASRILFWGGLVATLAATGLLARAARRALERRLRADMPARDAVPGAPVE